MSLYESLSLPWSIRLSELYTWLMPRDNHAEGMVFSKRIDIEKTFSGGERPSKIILKTYLRNLEKNIFRPKIYDFVIKIS